MQLPGSSRCPPLVNPRRRPTPSPTSSQRKPQPDHPRPPEAIADPAVQAAPRKYHTSMTTRAAYPNSRCVPREKRCRIASSPVGVEGRGGWGEYRQALLLVLVEHRVGTNRSDLGSMLPHISDL